jgi:hypothetical protein
LTLRLVFDDGKSTLVRFAGGPCDPDRLAPVLTAGTQQARPGDDLASKERAGRCPRGVRRS